MLKIPTSPHDYSLQAQATPLGSLFGSLQNAYNPNVYAELRMARTGNELLKTQIKVLETEVKMLKDKLNARTPLQKYSPGKETDV